MKITNIKPGQVVYDVVTHRMGNTMVRTVSVYTVKIIEVHAEDGYIVASWNHNAPRKLYGDTFRYHRNKPVLVDRFFGSKRLATREEIKAMKQAKQDAAIKR